MSTRLKRDSLLLNIVQLLALRSTCLRANVGALIAREGRIISTGYNGAPAGLPHCTQATCASLPQCTRTVHAEANAIAYAARFGVPVEGATLYCSYSPCLDCAKLIINSGVSKLVYITDYRDLYPLILLEEAHVAITRSELQIMPVAREF